MITYAKNKADPIVFTKMTVCSSVSNPYFNQSEHDRNPDTNGKADVSPVDFFLIYRWHITDPVRNCKTVEIVADDAKISLNERSSNSAMLVGTV